jgi:hypothetical protein
VWPDVSLVNQEDWKKYENLVAIKARVYDAIENIGLPVSLVNSNPELKQEVDLPWWEKAKKSRYSFGLPKRSNNGEELELKQIVNPGSYRFTINKKGFQAIDTTLVFEPGEQAGDKIRRIPFYELIVRLIPEEVLQLPDSIHYSIFRSDSLDEKIKKYRRIYDQGFHGEYYRKIPTWSVSNISVEKVENYLPPSLWYKKGN